MRRVPHRVIPKDLKFKQKQYRKAGTCFEANNGSYFEPKKINLPENCSFLIRVCKIINFTRPVSLLGAHFDSSLPCVPPNIGNEICFGKN